MVTPRRAGPRWIRAGNQVATHLAAAIPVAAQNRALQAQRPWLPFLGAQPPTDDGPAGLVDSGPLYAGANVGRVADIRPAAELVQMLTP